LNMVKKFLNRFLFALGFLTIIPGLGKIKVVPSDTGISTIFYPLVGLLMGGFLYLLSLVTIFSSLTISILMCVFLFGFTRGMHADGLGDTFDGFFSGKKDKKAIIAIMRDSRVGAMAIIAVFSVYLLKIALFYELLVKGSQGVPFYIIVAPVLSRGGVGFDGYLFRYAGGERGLGRAFTESIKLEYVVIGFLIQEGICLLGPSPEALFFPHLSFLFWFLWGLLCKKKIGGITGDTLGAGIELCEVFCLLVAVTIFL